MTEVKMLIQMVDQVVKPLLTVQEQLSEVSEKLNALKQQWEGLNYQSLTLYERWKEQETCLEAQVAELPDLISILKKQSKKLIELEESLQFKISKGIKEASNALVLEFEKETQLAIRQEVRGSAQELNKVLINAKEALSAYEGITLTKLILVAVMVGVFTGIVSFWSYRILTKTQPPCECKCVLEKIDGKELKDIIRSKL